VGDPLEDPLLDLVAREHAAGDRPLDREPAQLGHLPGERVHLAGELVLGRGGNAEPGHHEEDDQSGHRVEATMLARGCYISAPMDSAVRSLAELARRVRAGARRWVARGGGGRSPAPPPARWPAAAPAGARPLGGVVPDEPRAIALAGDIVFFLGAPAEGDDERVLHLPAVETSPYAEMSPD